MEKLKSKFLQKIKINDEKNHFIFGILIALSIFYMTMILYITKGIPNSFLQGILFVNALSFLIPAAVVLMLISEFASSKGIKWMFLIFSYALLIIAIIYLFIIMENLIGLLMHL